MRKPSYGAIKHKKLFILIFLLLFAVAGFYIYKYSYIYFERKKYDKVSIAIEKVTDGLRAQGIETTSVKKCTSNQDVYGPGATVCEVGILLKNKNINDFSNAYLSMEILLINEGFKINSNQNNSLLFAPKPNGSKIYNLEGSNLQCQLYAKSSVESSTGLLGFKCLDNSRFVIF